MPAKKMKFHEAMKRLDEIVQKLNSSDLELEDAMAYFEEGLNLTKQCETQLKEFEDKMDQLVVDKGDENVVSE